MDAEKKLRIGEMLVDVDYQHADRHMKFTAFSAIPLTIEDCSALQRECGYHPAGYGGPYKYNATYSIGNALQNNEGRGYTTTWYCTDNCD